MTRAPRQAALITSAVTTVVGALGVFLLLLQPWASCPGVDDSPAGCPVHGPQATIQAVTMLLAVAGGLGLLGCLLWPSRSPQPPVRRLGGGTSS